MTCALFYLFKVFRGVGTIGKGLTLDWEGVAHWGIRGNQFTNAIQSWGTSGFTLFGAREGVARHGVDAMSF